MSVTKGSIYQAVYYVYGTNGQLVNPTSASLVITKPDNTAVTPAPSITLPPAQTGILTYDYVTADEGRHTGFWTTGSPTTTRTFTFYVDPSVPIGIFSLAEGKAHLNLDPLSFVNDDELSFFINVVTRIVEHVIGPVVPRTITEQHDNGYCIMLRHGPVISLTSIGPWLTAGENINPADCRVNPVTWKIERKSGIPFQQGPYAVTFLAGRTIIEPNVMHGAKEILRHIWETQRGPSMVGPGPGLTEDDQSFAIQGRAWTVPRSVLESLAPESIGPSVNV